MPSRLLSWLKRHFRAVVLAGLMLVAYAAALNRDQVLPWAVAALLAATLITGLAWPYGLIRRLAVTRTGPERAEEGETVSFLVDVENHGWLPRFMVELVDRLPFNGEAAEKTCEEMQKPFGVIACIPGKSQRRYTMPLHCEKRGFYRLGPISLASSFPLGLAEVRRTRGEGVQTLTVYPDVFTIVHLPLRGSPSQIHRGGYLLPEGAGSAEFCGLREYRRGDNPRHIHWPTTARLNELMVKEFEPLASACLHLVLDLNAGANVGSGRHATLEYALRIAASIARYATLHGLRIRLSAAGAAPLHIPAGSGELHYQAILDALAVADADGETPYAGLLEQVSRQSLPGETAVVFLAAPQDQTVAILGSLSLLRARRAHLFAVMLDRDSFAPLQEKHPTGRPASRNALFAGLLDLDAHCVPVRNRDDLSRLFNP